MEIHSPLLTPLNQRLRFGPRLVTRTQRDLETSDFLRQCEVASRSNPMLNDDALNRSMCSKLSDWLVTRWAHEVHNVRQYSGQYPAFTTFVYFLEKEADIACDPVLILKPGKSEKPETKGDKSHAVAKTLNTVQSGSKCQFCGRNNHTLDVCLKFRDKSFPEKQAFIGANGLCFGCFKTGHLSKNSKKHLQCNTCKQRHATVFHSDRSEASKNNEVASKDVTSATITGNKADAESHMSLLVQDSKSSKCTMIVPVCFRATSPRQTDRSSLMRFWTPNRMPHSSVRN